MIIFLAFLLIVATLIFVGYPLVRPLLGPESEASIEEEVARLRRETRRSTKLACYKCGASYNRPGDKFCHYCGSKLDIPRGQ